MSSAIIGFNLAIGLGVAGIAYATGYLNLSQSVIQATTRPTHHLIRSEAEQTGEQLRGQFSEIVHSYLDSSLSGNEIDVPVLAENLVRDRLNEPILPEQKLEPNYQKKKIELGLLYSNCASVRKLSSGFPIEFTVESLYHAMHDLPNTETWIGAFDKDLWVIQDQDFEYNATINGVMKKGIGVHQRLDTALELLEDQFGGNAEESWLYIVTGPIQGRRNREKAEILIDEYREQDIRVGIIYIAKNDNDVTEPLTNNHVIVTPEDFLELPAHIIELNSKIMEESQ